MARTKTGLDVLMEQKLDRVRGKRIGLVTNHSAVTRSLVHIVDALNLLQVDITALFAPEHGIRGDIPAGVEVPNGIDEKTGIPIYSLYGRVRKPTREMLQDIDLMLFDVQDIGCRFYTYIYTMSQVMQACGECNKPFIILDRPNPIGGKAGEGNIPEKEFTSSVGLHPIAIRHGMTMGELALMFKGECGFITDVDVIMCLGWKRSMYFQDIELSWVMPSPNMPTPDTALLYPGTCLLEGTNVSEGRGTTRPFELIGAPWIDGHALADRMNILELPGVSFRPTFFTPTTSKFAQERCSGVQVHIFDRTAVEPVRIGLYLIKAMRFMYPDDFQFLPAGPAGKPFFDLLAGTDKMRLSLDSQESVETLIDSWYYDLCDFVSIRKKYLLYM